MKTLAAIVAFVAVALLAWFVIYPFVFNGVSGLFETNDLGTIVALAVCVLVTVPLIWLAIGLTGLAYVAAGVAEDQRRYKRERARRLERNKR